MELAIISLKQIITMFIIMAVGYFCYKKKAISEDNNKALSNIVLNIVNPAVIFMSYQIEFSRELLGGLLWSVLLSALSFAIMIIIAYFLVPAKSSNSGIERIAVIYSNCGFIGIPLIRAMIGDIGVFYLAAYLTVFNILLWTQGVILMTGKADFKSSLKSLLSPCIIAVFAGVACFAAGIMMPDIIGDAIGYVADMNTPLAMLVAGVTVARTDIIKALNNRRVYYITLIKLIIIPAAVVLGMSVFARMGVDRNIVMMTVIATACPTGASGTLFAIRFNRDELYASELFGISTLLSAVSIPIIMLISGYLIN